MKTKVLMFILMIMCSCTSCVKEDDTTEAQAGGNETKSSVDEAKDTNEVESETIYEYWKDDDIVWLDGQWNQFDGSYEYGKVTYDGRFERLITTSIGKYEDRLFGIQIEEGSGKTAVELYEKYVKTLDAKTEFYGMLDDAILSDLEQRKQAQIMVFLTNEQVKNIVSAGCPDDMMIKVRWGESFIKQNEVESETANYGAMTSRLVNYIEENNPDTVIVTVVLKDNIDLQAIEEKVMKSVGVTNEELQQMDEYALTLSDEENILYQQELAKVYDKIALEKRALVKEYYTELNGNFVEEMGWDDTKYGSVAIFTPNIRSVELSVDEVYDLAKNEKVAAIEHTDESVYGTGENY